MFISFLISWAICKCTIGTGRRKFILENNINKVDDIAINVASAIPSSDEVIHLEEKALVYLKDIKTALSSRFNCKICLITCESIPERFSVPIVNDWVELIFGIMLYSQIKIFL